MRILLFLLLIIFSPKPGLSQEIECDKYYIFDLRDSIINFSPVVLFKMYTDINTTNYGTYTTLAFVDQNSDTLNEWPSYANELPLANTPYDTLEYALWYANGFTSFPADFDGVLLMDVPYCEVPYNHTSSTPVENIEDSPIQLFPNPTNDFITLKNYQKGSCQFYTIDGKLILIKKVESDRMDISSLSPGSYMVTFINELGVVYNTGKIIKK